MIYENWLPKFLHLAVILLFSDSWFLISDLSFPSVQFLVIHFHYSELQDFNGGKPVSWGAKHEFKNVFKTIPDSWFLDSNKRIGRKAPPFLCPPPPPTPEYWVTNGAPQSQSCSAVPVKIGIWPCSSVQMGFMQHCNCYLVLSPFLDNFDYLKICPFFEVVERSSE